MDEPLNGTALPEAEIPEAAELEDEENLAVAEVEEAADPEPPAPAAAEAEAAAAEPAGAEECDDESYDLEAVEVAVEQTLTRTRVISRLKAIVLELEGGSLEIEGVPVAELGDEVEFEIEYCESEGKHELEIELEW